MKESVRLSLIAGSLLFFSVSLMLSSVPSAEAALRANVLKNGCMGTATFDFVGYDVAQESFGIGSCRDYTCPATPTTACSNGDSKCVDPVGPREWACNFKCTGTPGVWGPGEKCSQNMCGSTQEC